MYEINTRCVHRTTPVGCLSPRWKTLMDLNKVTIIDYMYMYQIGGVHLRLIRRSDTGSEQGLSASALSELDVPD